MLSRVFPRLLDQTEAEFLPREGGFRISIGQAAARDANRVNYPDWLYNVGNGVQGSEFSRARLVIIRGGDPGEDV